MTQGIYKLINNKNSKVYIGQSNNIEERYKSHMYMLENNTHHAYKLQRMYNKYKNLKHFKIEFDILEIVSNDKYLDARENYYIQFYNSHHNGYNSIGTNGDKTHTKKLESQNKKLDKIKYNEQIFNALIDRYKNSIIHTRKNYNTNSMYMLNEAIQYFAKNYNKDDYTVKLKQNKSKVSMIVESRYFNYSKYYVYSIKDKKIVTHLGDYKWQLERKYNNN